MKVLIRSHPPLAAHFRSWWRAPFSEPNPAARSIQGEPLRHFQAMTSTACW
nr:hypothetical protein [Streptomyces angustmyceticus]